MKIIYPEKLDEGDEIRIVAPSRSMAIISKETREIANKRFKEMGFKLSFGKNIEENNDLNSSKIESKIEDIQEAFLDKNVKGVITVIGGYNSNQLLKYIDWDIVKNNPKIFCGFYDIAILNNAILQKTGLVNYYGPHYSSFGQKLYFDYTLDYFKKCLMDNGPFDVFPSDNWSDDEWYKNQEERNLIKNEGWFIVNEGESKGTILGGNISTFNLLQGTEYFPEFKNTILFLEDDDLPKSFSDVEFDRSLQSIIHQPLFNNVLGIIIGRFQKASCMTNEKIKKIIKSKKELVNIPVIANVDFGHTSPMITFPIGGEVELLAKEKSSKIKITKH